MALGGLVEMDLHTEDAATRVSGTAALEGGGIVKWYGGGQPTMPLCSSMVA